MNETWYIVKDTEGYCQIVPEAPKNVADDPSESPASQTWGPFASQADAIAKRIGLIRAGKCKPR
ncbi:MAG: DDE transposase family protein [Desertifilum sp. SIO1I2]|nr:DDE transposase family protein [Desertifilum sp. SIO1I2]